MVKFSFRCFYFFKKIAPAPLTTKKKKKQQANSKAVFCFLSATEPALFFVFPSARLLLTIKKNNNYKYIREERRNELYYNLWGQVTTNKNYFRLSTEPC